jgi:hypothetical protein
MIYSPFETAHEGFTTLFLAAVIFAVIEILIAQGARRLR